MEDLDSMTNAANIHEMSNLKMSLADWPCCCMPDECDCYSIFESHIQCVTRVVTAKLRQLIR